MSSAPSTMVVRNNRDISEKQCCSGNHKQCKTHFKDHMQIISLYIYKELKLKTKEDLRSNESNDHYHEDGNLVPMSSVWF